MADYSPYPARAVPRRTVDGDTFYARIDQGYRVLSEQRIRVAEVDTPELHAKDPTVRSAARAAAAATGGWLIAAVALTDSPWPIVVRTLAEDSFGRWVSYVTRTDGEDLGEYLLTNGYAVPYVR